jgi:hypothetical protein
MLQFSLLFSVELYCHPDIITVSLAIAGNIYFVLCLLKKLVTLITLNVKSQALAV